MTPRCVIAFLLLALCAGIGCSGQSYEKAQVAMAPPQKERAGFRKDAPIGVGGLRKDAPAGGEANAVGEADGIAAERKVIQEAKLEVQVTHFEEAQEEVRFLIKSNKGYIAKSDFSGSAGTKRSGTWFIRIPADKFQTFVDSIIALGKPLMHKTEAQDVTDEYVDLEARTRNLKAEEETLNTLMKKNAQSTNEILAYRQQITNLRGDIERMEARLNILGKLTSLSTVHLTIREEQEYVPPPVTSPPIFAAKLEDAFGSSMTLLEHCGRILLLTLVAIGPWSPLILIVVGFFAWQLRRIRRAIEEPPLPTGPHSTVPKV